MKSGFGSVESIWQVPFISKWRDGRGGKDVKTDQLAY